jgi:hypothetical protein
LHVGKNVAETLAGSVPLSDQNLRQNELKIGPDECNHRFLLEIHTDRSQAEVPNADDGGLNC